MIYYNISSKKLWLIFFALLKLRSRAKEEGYVSLSHSWCISDKFRTKIKLYSNTEHSGKCFWIKINYEAMFDTTFLLYGSFKHIWLQSLILNTYRNVPEAVWAGPTPSPHNGWPSQPWGDGNAQACKDGGDWDHCFASPLIPLAPTAG